jgi:hypothetical protein
MTRRPTRAATDRTTAEAVRIARLAGQLDQAWQRQARDVRAAARPRHSTRRKGRR